MPEKLTIRSTFGNDELARVFVAKTKSGKTERFIEFAESVQPPIPRDEKWVIIISSLAGCPVKCPICDANSQPGGRLSKKEILEQIDYLVVRRFPDRKVTSRKFKTQFSRMGEPSLNPAVLEVLWELPNLYDAPGLMPCISTVAPRKGKEFLEKLIGIKNSHYPNGKFQLQFSIHSTNEEERDYLIPFPKWELSEIAEYGERFFEPGDRKITLNFSPPRGFELNPRKLRKYFDPPKFFVKLTPINPTRNQAKNGLVSLIDPTNIRDAEKIAETFEKEGFETLLSIGELEENKIGSNCGQFITKI
ncbi:MAG: hypothetical protein Kow0090_17840 [Myxococcota bacterium]